LIIPLRWYTAQDGVMNGTRAVKLSRSRVAIEFLILPRFTSCKRTLQYNHIVAIDRRKNLTQLSDYWYLFKPFLYSCEPNLLTPISF
jgi:hypothetical protein